MKKVEEQDAQIRKLKLEKKLLMKAHLQEIRGRERKELAALFVFCGLVMLYAYLALLVRGFV